jgi:hypothetical protein
MHVRKYEFAWGSAIGGVFAWRISQWQAELAHSIRVFRKPWMRYSTQVIVFGMAYYCGSMIPSRVLSKFSKGSDASH